MRLPFSRRRSDGPLASFTVSDEDGNEQTLLVYRKDDQEVAHLSPWKRNPDGSLMADEDGKLVTEAFFEMQRSVAERAFAIWQESGSWLQAGLAFGEGPAWAEAICRRYGLVADAQ